MDNIGGAEKLVLMLAKELNADVITTNINQKAIKKFGFDDISIKSIGNVPSNWPWKQLKTLLLFRFKKLESYNLFIMSGEWCVSAAKKNKPSIWYVHSLPKYIWDFYEQKLAQQKTLVNKLYFKFWSRFFKFWNYKYAACPNIIVCNSNNTQRKLITNIKRDSILVYPPVNIGEYYFKKFGDFWLSVNRISEHKRLELQVETFALLKNKKLIVVGGPENTSEAKNYFHNLKNNAPKNVTFLGEISDEALKKLYAECKAFITTAEDEDFGMTPIEAMASGKPVVAPNEGGYKETIINKKTGVLCSSDITSLLNAIDEVSKNGEKYKNHCLERAKYFSTQVFFRKINHLIKPFKNL
ncbi:glycosyltransferase [Patescibacteria group bacterium]|nr:glycosyltransferase [Patescibacteria group bacterium]